MKQRWMTGLLACIGIGAAPFAAASCGSDNGSAAPAPAAAAGTYRGTYVSESGQQGIVNLTIGADQTQTSSLRILGGGAGSTTTVTGTLTDALFGTVNLAGSFDASSGALSATGQSTGGLFGSVSISVLFENGVLSGSVEVTPPGGTTPVPYPLALVRAFLGVRIFCGTFGTRAAGFYGGFNLITTGTTGGTGGPAIGVARTNTGTNGVLIGAVASDVLTMNVVGDAGAATGTIDSPLGTAEGTFAYATQSRAFSGSEGACPTGASPVGGTDAGDDGTTAPGDDAGSPESGPSEDAPASSGDGASPGDASDSGGGNVADTGAPDSGLDGSHDAGTADAHDAGSADAGGTSIAAPVAAGIAYSALSGGEIYFTDGTKIYAVSVAGGTPHVVFPTTTAASLAAGANDLYWRDSTSIYAAPFSGMPDGGVPAPIVTGETPVALAVDATSLYWTNSNGVVRKSAATGGAKSTLATTGSTTLSMIAVGSQNVIWTDSKSATTGLLDYLPAGGDGGVQSVSSTAGEPYYATVALSGSVSWAYWLVNDLSVVGNVYRFALPGGAAASLTGTNGAYTTDFAVDPAAGFFWGLGSCVLDRVPLPENTSGATERLDTCIVGTTSFSKIIGYDATSLYYIRTSTPGAEIMRVAR